MRKPYITPTADLLALAASASLLLGSAEPDVYRKVGNGVQLSNEQEFDSFTWSND